MTDKKLTDEEIIKRLERCVNRGNLNYDTDIVLDLINRQKSEIERLKKEVSVARDAYVSIQDRYEHSKVESYKKFAEKLKNILRNIPKWNVKKLNFNNVGFSYDDVFFSIDNLLKEMVGEEE